MVNQGKWEPGFKHAAFRPGRIAKDSTTAILSIENHNFRITVEPEVDPDMPEGWGRDFQVTFGHGRKFVQFDPTHMTEDDLEKLRDFFDLVIQLAMPVAQRRDELAEQGRKKGDDTFTRLYRRVSPLVVRQGPLGEYDPGLRGRCPGLLGRLEAYGSKLIGPGNVGSAVAQQPEKHLGEADDGSEDNEP